MSETLERYSIEKVAEGGRWTQKEALALAKENGASRAVRSYSPYVGQYGIEVTATPEVHEKLSKIYFRGGY
jgi:hypothetical protein